MKTIPNRASGRPKGCLNKNHFFKEAILELLTDDVLRERFERILATGSKTNQMRAIKIILPYIMPQKKEVRNLSQPDKHIVFMDSDTGKEIDIP